MKSLKKISPEFISIKKSIFLTLATGLVYLTAVSQTLLVNYDFNDLAPSAYSSFFTNNPSGVTSSITCTEVFNYSAGGGGNTGAAAFVATAGGGAPYMLNSLGTKYWTFQINGISNYNNIKIYFQSKKSATGATTITTTYSTDGTSFTGGLPTLTTSTSYVETSPVLTLPSAFSTSTLYIRLTVSGGTGGTCYVENFQLQGNNTVAVAAPTWSTTGNAALTEANNFLGTTDITPLVFKVSNVFAGKIDPKGLTFFGYQAGKSNSTGKANAAFGNGALSSNTTGGSNTAMGSQSLYSNNIGNYNTAFGNVALSSNTSGNSNTAIGNAALLYNTIGINNVAVGNQSLYSNISGNHNNAVGLNSLYLNTTGSENTAFGTSSLTNNTIGNNNIAIGGSTLGNNTTSSSNIAIGKQALFTQSFNNAGVEWAGNNIAIGQEALYSNQPTTTSNGNFNTAVGNSALRTNTTGSRNTANGNKALFANTTGQYNTALGEGAMQNVTTGNYNTATGMGALQSALLNATGSENTASGWNTLFVNSTGTGNTSTGSYAMASNTTGNNNTANGRNALGKNTTAINNTAIGSYAGYAFANGNNNTFIGYGADATVAALTNSTAIGYNAIFSASNVMVLGNGANVGIGYSAPAYKLAVNGTAGKTGSSTWTVISDARLKKNVSPFKDGLDILMQINPVWFSYNGKAETPENNKYVGVIAQDMKKIAPYTVGTFNYIDKDGNKTDYLDYDANAVTYILINSIKEQQKQIDELKKTVASLSGLNTIQNTQTGSTNNINVDLSDKNIIVLNQNVPNPFAEQTTISFNIPETASASQVQFYNNLGQVIKTVEVKSKGKGQLTVFANDLSVGVYSYALIVDGKVFETKGMVKGN